MRFGRKKSINEVVLLGVGESCFRPVRARAFVKYDTHGISSYDSTSELLFHKVGIIKVKKTLLLQKVSIANPEKRTEGRKELSPMPANANEFQEGLSFFLNVARSVQYRALCFPGKIIRSGNREPGKWTASKLRTQHPAFVARNDSDVNF